MQAILGESGSHCSAVAKEFSIREAQRKHFSPRAGAEDRESGLSCSTAGVNSDAGRSCFTVKRLTPMSLGAGLSCRSQKRL